MDRGKSFHENRPLIRLVTRCLELSELKHSVSADDDAVDAVVAALTLSAIPASPKLSLQFSSSSLKSVEPLAEQLLRPMSTIFTTQSFALIGLTVLTET